MESKNLRCLQHRDLATRICLDCKASQKEIEQAFLCSRCEFDHDDKHKLMKMSGILSESRDQWLEIINGFEHIKNLSAQVYNFVKKKQMQFDGECVEIEQKFDDIQIALMENDDEFLMRNDNKKEHFYKAMKA